MHASSDAHLASVEKLRGANAVPIGKVMTEALEKEQEKNRAVYREVISTLRGLVRCGSALLGHDARGGKLMTLLEERGETSPEMKSWLQRRNNYLSHECQDELVNLMASMVLREILEEARRSPFYGVIADGTTDVSTKEQFSICIRYATDELLIKEACLGLYEVPGSTASELHSALKDALQRTMYGVDKLRGHCFDGASNMSGRVSGVKARLSEDQPKSVYVHCANHSLDLALQEEAKKIPMVADALNTVREVAAMLKTTKRRKLFDDHARDLNLDESTGFTEVPHRLMSLCPTRWTVRCKTIQRFLGQYNAVVLTLEDVATDVTISPDVRHKARGYLSMLQKYETLFGLVTCEKIFAPCELFATALQRPEMNCGDVRKGADLLLDRLEHLRQCGFQEVWEQCETSVKEFEVYIESPREPRPKHPPKRFEHTADPAAPALLTAKTALKMSFIEAIDLVKTEVDKRFNQDGLKQVQAMEDVLLGRVAEDSTATSLRQLLSPFKDDFDPDALAAQLTCLHGSGEPRCNAVNELISRVRSQGQACQAMLSEVLRLATLVAVVPVSGASAERSFSVLSRVKTCLRSTMGQLRLSSLVVLAVHREQAKNLDFDSILREFVNRHPKNRVSTFGRV